MTKSLNMQDLQLLGGLSGGITHNSGKADPRQRLSDLFRISEPTSLLQCIEK